MVLSLRRRVGPGSGTRLRRGKVFKLWGPRILPLDDAEGDEAHVEDRVRILYRRLIAMELLTDFCIDLCADEEFKGLARSVANLPEDVRDRLLNAFVTRVLSRKIHPVREDDVIMGSQEPYRHFIGLHRATIGRSTNESTLEVLERMTRLSNSRMFSRPYTYTHVIESHLKFTPSKSFMSRTARSKSPPAHRPLYHKP